MKFRKITALASVSAVFAAMLVPITVSQAAETTFTAGADETYTTISAAVAAAKEINPQSEDARVTINVDPGDYEEQVKIEGLKYVTLRQTPDTTGKVNLHWYYCTGYCAGDCGGGCGQILGLRKE